MVKYKGSLERFRKDQIVALYFTLSDIVHVCSGTQCGGFQFLLIVDLWGISFHAVVVFGLGKNLLFKSVLGHCAVLTIHHTQKDILSVLCLHCQPIRVTYFSIEVFTSKFRISRHLSRFFSHPVHYILASNSTVLHISNQVQSYRQIFQTFVPIFKK